MNYDFIFNVLKDKKINLEDKDFCIFTSLKYDFTIKYDIIIAVDLFSLNEENQINETIEDSIKYLKNDGKLIFIEQLKTDRLNLYSFFKNCIHHFIPVVKKDVFIEYVYDILRYKELYILDADRIYNSSNLLEDNQYFSIICFKKYN